MNILLVSSKYMPEYSGSGYRAHQLYKRLTAKAQNLNLTVLCASTTENSSADYEYDGFQVKRIAGKKYLRLSGNRFIRSLQITRNFLNEHRLTREFLRAMPARPDLVHVFGKSYVNASVLDVAREQGIPALIELCNEMDTPQQFVPFLLRSALSAALPDQHHFVCISAHLHQLCRHHGIPEEKIWCRPNPVEENRFSPIEEHEKFRLRKALSKFAESDVLIVYIAKFRPSKNHRFLLEVLTELPSNYKLFMKGPLVTSGPQAKGDQALYENLNREVQDKKLADRVELAFGFCERPEDYYRMADVYAFPSLEEGLGTPVLENIASGIPVVANLIPGATDQWIKNGENGFLGELRATEFAQKISAAAAFPAEQRLRAAAEIMAVAGTKAIDAQYLELIKKYEC